MEEFPKQDAKTWIKREITDIFHNIKSNNLFLLIKRYIKNTHESIKFDKISQ